MTKADSPIRDVVQGKWLGVPPHATLVHFPIALWTISLLADLASLYFHENWLVRGAYYTLATGVVMAALAAPVGFVDWLDLRKDHPGRSLGILHMSLNVIALALYAVSLYVRLDHKDAVQTPLLPLVLSAVAFGLISLSGYVGGAMVYEDGVGVGRHRRRGPSPDKTVDLSARPSAQGFVVACDEQDLAENQPRRFELDGTAICLVKVNGQPCAFQDFCTHRFGPLSEGAFTDGKVACPWHNSRFDCRTGQVLSGPAKVPLRTYDVRVVRGKVEVRTVRPPAENK